MAEGVLEVQNIPYWNVSWPDPLPSWETTTSSSEDALGTISADQSPTIVKAIFLGVSLSLIACATILGNMLVILSVCMDRHLHSPPNVLIVNLAVADLLVGLLVMPFAIAELVGSPWTWIAFICDVYISADVLSCTASIVTLCMISVDRYLAITRPFKYSSRRTPRLMAVMVAAVWTIGAFISLSPQIWGNVTDGNNCLLTQEKVYTVYSTGGAFYLPLAIMLIVYYKVYRAAKRSQRAERQRRPSGLPNSRRGSNSMHAADDAQNGSDVKIGTRKSIFKVADYIKNRARPSIDIIKMGNGKSRISLRGERKAAKTLGVIMGAFTVCWLPFFLLAVVRPFCNCNIPPLLDKVLLWLGYVNSAINPVIYPLFNRDFVPAYKRLLGCKCLGDCEFVKRSTSYAPRYFSGSMAEGQTPIAKRDLTDDGDRYRGGPTEDHRLTTTDSLHDRQTEVDRRPSDLDKISEVSDESGCAV